MLDQIQEVVRKNLPAELGEQLKKHLADAETWKRERDHANAKLEDANRAVGTANYKIADLEGKLKLAGDLDKREKDVTAREVKIDVTLANLKAVEAEKRADAVTALAGQVFRNPRFVTNETSSVQKPTQGGGVHYASDSKTKTEEVE